MTRPYLWYNTIMIGEYRVETELTGDAKMLAEAAKEASRDAVARTFAAGLPVHIIRDNKLIRIDPNGTETVVKELGDD